MKPVPRLAEAFAYALELHREQVRKQAEGEDPRDGIPYIGHLMLVAALVLEHGGGETEAIAALLHDGPEDQGGKATLEEIERRFGTEVAEIVDFCTDTFDSPKPDWWTRKRAYCRRLEVAPDRALLVSLADKTHNLEATLGDVREAGEDAWNRFSQGRLASLGYYATLLALYRRRISPDQMPRAVRLVDRMESALGELCRDYAERKAALAAFREGGDR